MQKVFVYIFLCLILFSCKTISVRDAETTGNVIFRDLMTNSEKLDEVFISGLFRIEGLEDLPSVFIHFESQGSVKENKFSFRISSFRTPLIDINIINDEVILINHTKSQFIKLELAQIDFSKVTGINFNPIELSYFFLGKIPYSEDAELMDFKWNRKEYILDLTDSDSKYTLYLNADKEIIAAKIFSQYFDEIQLDSVKYKKNKNEVNIPHMLSFSNTEKDIKMSFVINKISYKKEIENFLDLNILKEYKQISSLEEMQIDIKNK